MDGSIEQEAMLYDIGVASQTTVVPFNQAPAEMQELVDCPKTKLEWMIIYPSHLITKWHKEKAVFDNYDLNVLPKALGKDPRYYKAPNGDCIVVTSR